MLDQYKFFYTLTAIKDWMPAVFSCYLILFSSKQNVVHDGFRDEGIQYSQQCSTQQENHNGFELFSEWFHQNKKVFFPIEQFLLDGDIF